VELELEIATPQHLARGRVTVRHPIAAIPELHRTATVLPLRDSALEVAIVQRVVLDLDCEAPRVRIERWTLGHCPGLEDAIEFQAQVIMQPRGGVLLDDVAQML